MKKKISKKRTAKNLPAIRESKDLQIAATGQNAVSVHMDPRQLAAALENESQCREIIERYIKKSLTEGIDYGRIHISTGCTTYGCDREDHLSKPTIYKPGGEKLTSLFRLIPTFIRDDETLAMLPETMRAAGLVAFICRLVDQNGKVVSEGRGACTLAERGAKPNTTIKIAEKRAQIDAVLRLGYGLSGIFGQDFGGDEEETITVKAEVVTPAAPEKKVPEAVKNPEKEKMKKEIKDAWNKITATGRDMLEGELATYDEMDMLDNLPKIKRFYDHTMVVLAKAKAAAAK